MSHRTAPYYDVLSDAEYDFMNHMSRWGSDGYPVMKLGRGWHWCEAFGIRGAPGIYKTKREAFAAVERYLDTLRERVSKRAKELAERAA